ncbi:YadA-like family protein [Pseudomarimonas arenosa]|uniref:YadA-like family protein n=1 Tax=Pseudomarimonas arenosa TaxID=2774145 RepID=A0AAW3ZMT0_9GAMM|nr:YadA-like family protein [Pseudomarimonas arenosa]MBD8527278.1 YadA-like family protein [Pseudomarimonas arenosa]
MLKKSHLALVASLLLASPMAFSQSLPDWLLQPPPDRTTPPSRTTITPSDGSVHNPCPTSAGTIYSVGLTGPYAAGDNAIANCSLATATGPDAFAQNMFASAYGAGAWASGEDATAVGGYSIAHGDGNTAFGSHAWAIGGIFNTAVGSGARVGDGDHVTALGSGAYASGDGALVSGAGARAFGFLATAYGTSSRAEGVATLALGSSAQALADGCTALGAGSVCDQENTISVGTSEGQRRIVNVADGVEDTDAATVGQMNQADQHWYNQAISYVDLRIGDRVDLSEVYNRLDTLDGRVDGLDRAVASLGTRLDKLGAMSAAQAALAASGVAAQGGKGSVGMAVGSYNGQQAAALGYSKAFRLSSGRPVGVTLQAAFSGETSVGAAVSIGLR